jgi:TetR/AcrR family fatty acid metabolism transcriptional regulator
MNVHSAGGRLTASSKADRRPRTPQAEARPPAATADRPLLPRGDKYDLILRAAGTVYLYFVNKDDLLVSIFERSMREAIAEGRAAIAAVDDPVERLRRIGRLHLERMGRDRDLAVVFQVELRQSTKFMEQFSSTALREYLGIIRDAIADAQVRNLFRRDVNPTFAAKVLFGALDEMATNWVLSRRRYSLAADADRVMDLFLNGVKA